MEKDKTRTLSEEFYSLSPKSQSMIKFHTINSPTSKYKKEYTNIDKYNESTPAERTMMEQHGLIVVPLRICVVKSNIIKNKENIIQNVND